MERERSRDGVVLSGTELTANPSGWFRQRSSIHLNRNGKLAKKSIFTERSRADAFTITSVAIEMARNHGEAGHDSVSSAVKEQPRASGGQLCQPERPP